MLSEDKLLSGSVNVIVPSFLPGSIRGWTRNQSRTLTDRTKMKKSGNNDVHDNHKQKLL